jgi:hypothetical protein
MVDPKGIRTPADSRQEADEVIRMPTAMKAFLKAKEAANCGGLTLVAVARP